LALALGTEPFSSFHGNQPHHLFQRGHPLDHPESGVLCKIPHSLADRLLRHPRRRRYSLEDHFLELLRQSEDFINSHPPVKAASRTRLTAIGTIQGDRLSGIYAQALAGFLVRQMRLSTLHAETAHESL
jgi:hypothetical protein